MRVWITRWPSTRTNRTVAVPRCYWFMHNQLGSHKTSRKATIACGDLVANLGVCYAVIVSHTLPLPIDEGAPTSQSCVQRSPRKLHYGLP